MFKAWTIGWAGWVGDKRFLKAWRGSWHWGDCPDLKTESIGERCIWGPGTGRGPTVTTHTSRIQSSVCMGATWHTTLYAYRQQPFKVLPEGIYNIQWTGHPITAANANQYHLLLRMRHQMLWAPPSKLPLFFFNRHSCVLRRKEPEDSKMLQWISMWMSSWHIFPMLSE